MSYRVDIYLLHAWEPTLRLTKVRSYVHIYVGSERVDTVYDLEPYDGLIPLSLPAGTYSFSARADRMKVAWLPDIVVDGDRNIGAYLEPYYTMGVNVRDRSIDTWPPVADAKVECANFVPSVAYTSTLGFAKFDYGYDAYRKRVTAYASKPGYDTESGIINTDADDFEEDYTFAIHPTGWEPEPSKFEHVYVETYKDYEIHYFPLFVMYGVYLHPGVSPPEGPVPLSSEDWRTHETVAGCRFIIDNLVGEPVFVQNYPPPPTHMDPGWLIYREPAGSQRFFAVDAGTGQMVSAYWASDNLAGLIQWLNATYVTEGLVYTHRGIPVYFQLRDLEYYATVGTTTRHFYDWGFQACLDWIDDELVTPPAKPTTLALDVYPMSGTTPFDVNITAELTSNGSPVGYKNIDFYYSAPDAGVPNTLISRRATNASGVAEFVFRIGVSVPVNFYVHFVGDSEYEESISPTITVAVEEPPVGIPTTTTITAPDRVASGEGFDVYGSLIEKDTGTRIPGQRINLSYDGKSLGYTYTDPEGDYYFTVSIPEGGAFTLKAEFPGTPGYAASMSILGMSVETTLIATAIQIGAPLAVGTLLRYLGVGGI